MLPPQEDKARISADVYNYTPFHYKRQGKMAKFYLFFANLSLDIWYLLLYHKIILIISKRLDAISLKNISVMLKPASSGCNLRCKYCFYADVSAARAIHSYGLMSLDTADRILSNIFADLTPGDHLTLAFQGGEPTLAGLDFFRRITATVAALAAPGIQISYALQTNGLLLDDQWCAFLKTHGFLVGLSIDGPAAYHDANRVDSTGSGTFRRVLETKTLLDKWGVAYNVLMTLTASLARHPQQVWRFILEQRLDFVQFTPCLGAFEAENDPYALTPQRYAAFYSALFSKWYAHYRNGHYVSIKLFDDLVNLLAFGQCNACGLLGQCQRQIIVEADGSVYPCDFYVLDNYRAGNLAQERLRTVFESPEMTQFLSRPREPLPLCDECPYRNICGGGCQRMRHEVFYHPGDTSCGHRQLLDAIGPKLMELARLSRRAAHR